MVYATMESNKKFTRQTNIEFLRIMTMLFIVIYHLCCHGAKSSICETTPVINRIFVMGMNRLQGMSNCVFLMISGYFLVNSTVSWKKAFKLWFQCFFFSAIIGLFFFISRIPVIYIPGTDNIGGTFAVLSKGYLLKFLTPIQANTNWFTTTYLMFYILSPFYIAMVNNITKRQHLILCAICLFYGYIADFNKEVFYFNNMFYFITIFFIASYINKYDESIPDFFKKPLNCFASACLFLVVYFCIIISVNVIETRFNISPSRISIIENFYSGFKSVPIVFLGFLIFYGFKNIKMKHSKTINTIASTTLTVYLIHDNSLLRDFIWKKIFHIPEMLQKQFFIPYTVLAVTAIFTSCCILELLRKKTAEKVALKFYDFMSEKIHSHWNKKNQDKIQQTESN